MPFVRSYIFKAELSRPVLMDFIARTPAEAYFLLIPATGVQAYFIVSSEDTIEYLTNEFAVKSLEFLPSTILKQMIQIPGCKQCGDRGLLDI